MQTLRLPRYLWPSRPPKSPVSGQTESIVPKQVPGNKGNA